jgi:hypothetical protein
MLLSPLPDHPSHHPYLTLPFGFGFGQSRQEPSQELWAYYGPQLYAENQHTPDSPELQAHMSRHMDVNDSNIYDMTRPLGMMALAYEDPPSATTGWMPAAPARANHF